MAPTVWLTASMTKSRSSGPPRRGLEIIAFMFDGGRMMDLGTMGGSNSWAYGINDMGWMVGAAQMPMTDMHAFLCTNASSNPMMMDIGTLGGSNSAAWMIDMHGDMVGWAAMTNGSQHGFFMTNSVMGNMMDLGTAGGTNSELYCKRFVNCPTFGAWMCHNLALRRRKAFATTETELKLIAALAMIGLSRIPKNG